LVEEALFGMGILSVQSRHGFLTDIDGWKRSLTANIVVTTVCNKRCPNCCYAGIVRDGNPRHLSPERIADEVRLVGDVAIVYLLGGEITMHPEFERLLTLARSARGRGKLMISTNGFRLREFEKQLWRIDGSMVTTSDRDHVDCGGGPRPCYRIRSTVGVREGRVYPCCVACGISDAPSTELSDGWERRVLEVEAPCERCVFGT